MIKILISNYGTKVQERQNWLRIFFLVFTSLLILVASFALFYFQARQWIASDYFGHLELYNLFKQNDWIIYPPLYYWTYDLLDEILWYKYDYILSTLLILSFSILAKYLLTWRYVLHSSSKYGRWTYLLPLVLLLFSPIYLFSYEGKYLYMGKFTSSIWHNCTSTFVWPFCILLFFFTLKWIRTRDRLHYQALWIIGVLICLAKPSFLFAFIPVLPVVLIVHRSPFKILMQGVFLCIGLLLLIYGAKVIIYDYGTLDSLIIPLFPDAKKNKVVFDLLGVWLHFVEYPILDIVSSFAFLIFALAVYGKALFRTLDFQFSFLLLLVSLLVFFLFAESGYRFADANFYWQIPISLYILYVVIVKNLLEARVFQPSTTAEKIKLGILSLLFLAHFFSGVHFIYVYLTTGIYL
ncbi:hypothetical protein SYJ56_19670 [Algoriphagus sp. D3-2-R+10]|uniref:hypothetical protein n=1 Tax=Algoriphagus aurantiacus TaxID=3103948 RepID=UPI002B368154|nr:hypothetical protein [Algoriphagus sp. D3-2-R+10]MEB2777544.1 hypothetical protein [Algoriphagus sp. D3-2-R+10]